MDFLDPNKKRSNRLKLYLGYILVAIAIGLGALVLLFAASGYGIDKSGRVIQNGLVFFDSQPGGAKIDVRSTYNKFTQDAVTDARMVLNEGRYKVTLTKDGYRSWRREFSVGGGTVERILYPLLFPANLETSNLKAYQQSPRLVTQSPDRHWIVVQQVSKLDSFDVFDANAPERPATTFAIPAGVLSVGKKSNTLTVVEWANDNSNILMKHDYDGQTEFVVVNKDKTTQSFNVDNLSKQKPYDVRLKDKSTKTLFLQAKKNGLLEEFNTKSKQLNPVVPQTLAYKSYGNDMLLYVRSNSSDKSQVDVHIRYKDKDYVLRQLPTSDKYLVDVARYNDKWYFVAGASNDNRVYVYRNAVEVLTAGSKEAFFVRTLRIDKPQNVSFSANTEFIAAQSGQKFVVYDAEYDREYQYTVPEKIDSTTPAKWMDGHRLSTSSSKTAYVFDFDGTNYQKLMPKNPATELMFDRDYVASYALSPATDKGVSTLTRTKLLVSN